MMLESFVEASCAVAIASATLVRVHRARAEARDPRDDTGLQVPNRPIGATVTASNNPIALAPAEPGGAELSVVRLLAPLDRLRYARSEALRLRRGVGGLRCKIHRISAWMEW